MSVLRRLAKRGLRRTGGGLLFGSMSTAVLSKAMPIEWIGSHLRELFEQLRINCVLDVGANEGQYALMLRDIGFKGRIVSFEPVKSNVERLLEWSKSDPNWSIQPLALGDADTQMEMNVTRWTVFSSLLELGEESKRFGSGGAVDHREVVQVRRLDTMMDELFAGLSEPRVYLKLDTQGYDLKVLAGAQRALQSVLALQSEVSTHETYTGEPGFMEHMQQLNSYGFAVTGMYPVSRRPDLRVNCFDCVMRRPDDRASASSNARSH